MRLLCTVAFFFALQFLAVASIGAGQATAVRGAGEGRISNPDRFLPQEPGVSGHGMRQDRPLFALSGSDRECFRLFASAPRSGDDKKNSVVLSCGERGTRHPGAASSVRFYYSSRKNSIPIAGSCQSGRMADPPRAGPGVLPES